MKYFLSKHWQLLVACLSVLIWLVGGIFWIHPSASDRLLVYEQTQNYQKAIELLEELRRESGLSSKREKQWIEFQIKLKNQGETFPKLTKETIQN